MPIFRRFVSMSLLTVALGLLPASAIAQGSAQEFVEQEHGKLLVLMRQSAGPGRDASISQELGRMVDYEELARRTFGKTCPATIPRCQNHWDELTAPQKVEVTSLLRKLVERNYKKNLKKTLDYEVAFKGSRSIANGDTKIRTEAKSKVKVREAPVTVDYVVVAAGTGFKVVDIVTEGSSLVKNYYEQFHRMLTTAGQGYPLVVKRLTDRIAAP